MTDQTVGDTGQVAAEYRTMQKIVTDYVRSAIISGRFGPGERLNQDDIATSLHVSRMPVREALRTLESEGLVELQPHRSAVVVSLRPEDIEEIFGIRAILEAGALARSAPGMSDATIERLRRIYAEMERALEHFDEEQWLRLNHEFHNAMLQECEWPRLRALIETQRNALKPYQRAAASLMMRATRAHEEHHAMLLAAEQRDGARLARLISEHLHATAEELIDYLSKRRLAG
jgi:DNA-binding GntR family transcriptional regulator